MILVGHANRPATGRRCPQRLLGHKIASDKERLIAELVLAVTRIPLDPPVKPSVGDLVTPKFDRPSARRQRNQSIVGQVLRMNRNRDAKVPV